MQVKDSGSGIAPDLIPRVFDRFVQADASSKRAHGGLGLGLSIVRHLVELHGGTVEAASAGEGKGAIFTIRLPVRAIAHTHVEEASSGAARAPEAPAAGASALADLRVLVVDDESDARDLLQTVLASYGARVVAEPSAADGMTRLARDRFDILIADIGMPGQDGYELIAAVRRLPKDAGGEIPAIALTAYGRVDDAARALAAGFHAHLAKPVSQDVLAMTVARLAGRSQTER